jgi:hypothetical protein
MNGFSKSCKFIGKICAVAASVFFVHETRGESAYLPSVGSPPLRFQVVSTNYFVFDSKPAAPAANPTKTSAVATTSATPTANHTNITEISNPISNSSANTNQTSAADEENNSETPIIPITSSSSASDLLTVSPQMITEYLKPAQTVTDTKTNQPEPVIFVPVEMQFTPPAPKSSSESRATYKTQ